MVERQAGRIGGRAVRAGINLASSFHKPPQEILHISITLQKLLLIGRRSLVRPMILTESDEPFVERHVLEQRIINETRVFQFKLWSAADNPFPLEVERGIQKHTPLHQVL